MNYMAINLGFQTKYILNLWCMLFHPVKVLLKVFSILFKIHSACCAYWLRCQTGGFYALESRNSFKIYFKALMHTVLSCTGFIDVVCKFIQIPISSLWNHFLFHFEAYRIIQVSDSTLIRIAMWLCEVWEHDSWGLIFG